MAHPLLLIDFSSIAHPIWHMAASDPNPDATSTQILDRVRGLASGLRSGVVICVDSKRSIRRQADPTYKANRKPEDRAPFYHQCDLALDALRAEGFPIWEVDGYEADDVVASATARALEQTGFDVLIASSDKDLMALVDDRVKIKSMRDGSEIGAAEVLAKFGVQPAQVHDYLALVGDASDNIRGANKIGPVTAVKLLSTYGTLDGVYRAIAEDEDAFSPAVKSSLGEFLTRVDDVKDLIRLRTDLPIPFDEIHKDRVAAPVLDGLLGFDDPFGSLDTPTGLAPADVVRLTEAVADEPVAAPTPDPVPAPTPAPAKSRPTRKPAEVKQADAAAKEAADKGTVVPFPPAVDGPGVVAEPAPDKPYDPASDHAAKQAAAAKSQAEKGSTAPLGAAVGAALAPVRTMVLNAEYTRQLEPQSMDEAKMLARYVFESRLFGAYGNPQAALMTIMAGREFGMPTMHSLRAFHVIDSKPVLASDTMRALVIRSGLAKYFRCTARTALIATFVTKRGDDPEISLSYTIDEAGAAGLLKAGSGWMKNPADMLVARASAKLARLVYPDIIHGVYAPEEID